VIDGPPAWSERLAGSGKNLVVIDKSDNDGSGTPTGMKLAGFKNGPV
jgi:hypothetical protein